MKLSSHKSIIILIFFIFSNNYLFSQPFVEQTGIILPGVSGSSVAWGDYNNDGYLDILLTGTTGSTEISKIYRNNGNNTFTEQTAISLTGVSTGSGSWADYDNDDDLDILLTGVTSKIYRNNGNNTFTEQTGISLQGVYWSSSSWGDFDNDGYTDILLTGWSNTGRVSKIYRNEGNNNFTELTSIPIKAVEGSSVAWGDYDNDSDLDILLTGLGSDARIYRNNGDYTFSEQPKFRYYEYSSSAWGDYDGDGDLDILITGRVGSEMMSKVYRNNNGINFTEQTTISLAGVYLGSVAWGDYDNDGLLDILLTGQNVSGSNISKIYRNNGNNNFTEQTTISLPGISSGSAAWGDYDNDNDLDIVLSGLDINGIRITKIFRNNNPVSNKLPGQPINLSYEIQKTGVILKWSRVITDETPSKSITYNIKTGRKTGGNNFISSNSAANGFRRIPSMGNGQVDTNFIYNNLRWDTTYYASVQAIDNSFKGGLFSNEVQFKISPVQVSGLTSNHINSNSLILNWKRGNGDRCIVFAKEGTSGTVTLQNYLTYYANPVFGESPPLGSTGWFCIYKGEADSVLISGLDPKKNYIIQAFEFQGKNGSEIYNTSSTGNTGVFSSGLFADQSGISLQGVYWSSSSWGDYDNDGDLDVLLSGQPSSGIVATKIYRNNSDNTFTEQTSILLTNIAFSSVAWGDYDNDNDLDVLITGSTNQTVSGVLSKIYRNNGNGTFTEQTTISLAGVFSGSVAWGDYDNDGDLDILLTGTSSSGPTSKIYRNNGDLSFSEQTGISLTGVEKSSVAWGDYDNDGDLDILLAGSYGAGNVSKIYRNNGDNSFSEQTGISLRGIERGSIAWGDYDNDGDPDILQTGSGATKIYNNQNNTFTEQPGISIAPLHNSACAWGDFDNDGYLDFVIAGTFVSEGSVSKVYRNNGNNTFSEQTSISLTGAYWGSVSWGDYDNDGDLDILSTGQDENGNKLSKIYRNNLIMKAGSIKPNIKPDKPSGLTEINNPNSTRLSWMPVISDETPAKTMTYNVRYKLKNSTIWKSASHSGDNGSRRLPAMGNSQLASSFNLKNLSAGTYFWQIQAVDQGYQGGSWSAVDSFVVKNVLSFFSADTVCQGSGTRFTNQSAAFGEAITGFKWIFDNGPTSAQVDPTFTFSSAGVKNVTLITYSATTSDTLTKQILVKTKPFVDFTTNIVCQGFETTLTNHSTYPGLTISSWSWDYGDGKGSIAQNPGTHGYLLPGSYKTILVAVATNGCSDTAVNPVVVAAKPVASISSASSTSFCAGKSVVLTCAPVPTFNYSWQQGGVPFTGATLNSFTATEKGSYIVVVINTLASECADTSSPVNVTVKEVPVKPRINMGGYVTGDCIGETPLKLSIIDPVPGYNYTWFKNEVPYRSNSADLEVLDQANYYVRAELDECIVFSDDTAKIYSPSSPPKPVIYAKGPTVWYLMSSIKSATTKYKWYYNGKEIPGAKSSTYVANQKLGKYNLSISNDGVCYTISDTLTIPVIGPTAIEDTNPFEGVKIYPNPATGMFTIEMDNNVFGVLYIDIFNPNGSKALNIKFEKSTEHFSTQIDLSGQSKGMYIINMAIEKFKATRKILIE